MGYFACPFDGGMKNWPSCKGPYGSDFGHVQLIEKQPMTFFFVVFWGLFQPSDPSRYRLSVLRIKKFLGGESGCGGHSSAMDQLEVGQSLWEVQGSASNDIECLKIGWMLHIHKIDYTNTLHTWNLCELVKKDIEICLIAPDAFQCLDNLFWGGRLCSWLVSGFGCCRSLVFRW